MATVPSAPPPHPVTAWQTIAVVAIACIAGAILRLHDIATRPLWLDEAYSAWFSALDWHRLWIETPLYETHPPFYYSLLKAWRVLAGGEAAALRGLSALAGVATIVAMAMAARLLGGIAAVHRPLVLILAAAALAAVSPRLLLIGQEARTYALMTFAYAVALVGWLRLARAFAATDAAAGPIRDWLLLGGAMLALLWLHGLGVLHAGAIVLATAAVAGRPAWTARWRRFAGTMALAGLLWLPCLAMIAMRRDGWAGGWLTWDAAGFPVALGNLYGLAAIGEDWTARAAFVLVPVLMYLAVKRLAARAGGRGMAFGLLALALAPPLAAALLSQMGTPVFLPRTLVAVLAPTYLLVAFALADVSRRAAIALGVALAAAFAINLTHFVTRPAHEPWDEIAATITREARPNDVLWVYPNDAALPLARELTPTIPIVSLPARYPAIDAPGTHPSGSPAVVAIDAAAARAFRTANRPAGGRILYLDYAPRLFDPDGSVANAVAGGTAPQPIRSWGEYRLRILRQGE